MSYEIYIVKPGTFGRKEKITHIESINWSDDIDNLYISFDFTSDKEYEAGSWVELYEKDDKKTVFYGLITKVSRSRKELYNYSGYDTGFYLLKNKITKQYRSSNISNAIKEACTEAQIKCGQIPDIAYTVSKIYKNNAIEDILKELLEYAFLKGLEKKYYYDCKNGYVNLYLYKENADLCGYVANIYKLKSTNTIHSFEISSSIEEMKNKVQIITSVTKNNQTTVTEKYTTPDNENVEKYGMLQEIIETDTDNKISPRTQAETKLKELNKVSNEISLTVLGDYNMRKGIVMPIENDVLNLSDKYLIKSSNHAIQGTKETVSIKIEKFEGVL